FIFRKEGIDIFLDSGMYNYQEDDIIRKYVRSAFAHNAIVVDGRSYELGKENIGKASLLDAKEENNYYYMHACHSLYEGVLFNRKLIYFKDFSSIFIHDC